MCYTHDVTAAHDETVTYAHSFVNRKRGKTTFLTTSVNLTAVTDNADHKVMSYKRAFEYVTHLRLF